MRALAKRIGVSERAIRKRFQRGCFPRSMALGRGGHPVVLDADLAVEEWEQVAVVAGGSQAQSAGSAAELTQPILPIPSSLVEAQLISTMQLAESRRIANGVKQGKLADVDRMAKDAFEDARVIREAVLNVCPRLSAVLAAETDAAKVFSVLDAALREALESASDRLLAAVGS